MLQITKSRIFQAACLSAIIGVIIAKLLLPIPTNFILITICLGCFLTGLFTSTKPKFSLILFISAGILFGVIRFNSVRPNLTDPNQVAYYNDKTKITFTGHVSAEPDIRIDATRLTITVEQMIRPETKPITGQILLKTTLYPEYSYGDQLEISCALQTPAIIEINEAKNFNYAAYLAKEKIYSVCYSPQITKLPIPLKTTITGVLLKFKLRLINIINQTILEPYAGFLAGILLGARRGIDPFLATAFQRTGTTHLIALSGYNITIIVTAILGVMPYLKIKRQRAAIVIIIFIFLFTLATGAGASIVRAAIMGTLSLIAGLLGRTSRIGNTLLLSATVMILLNPLILFYDIGFQLSFLSTCGLVYFSDVVKPLTDKLPEKFNLRDSFNATLSATIFTLPIILYNFGQMSIVALVVNCLVLPLIPYAMLTGFLACLGGLLYLPLATIINYLTFFILGYVVFVIQNFAQLPFSNINLDYMSLPVMLLVYLFLIFLIYQNRTR